MNETASADQPEPETPSRKGLGDKWAETWEEIRRIVLGMPGEEAKMRSAATSYKLREIKETKVDPSPSPEVK